MTMPGPTQHTKEPLRSRGERTKVASKTDLIRGNPDIWKLTEAVIAISIKCAF